VILLNNTHSLITHTHTHPFNGTFSGTTGVSQYQKGKTNLDFTEARDSEWQWHQLGHMQVCTSLQIDNHASTPPLSFYRPDALPAAQPALKDIAIMDISAHSSLCQFYLLLKSYFCCCCHCVTVDCSRVFFILHSTIITSAYNRTSEITKMITKVHVFAQLPQKHCAVGIRGCSV